MCMCVPHDKSGTMEKHPKGEASKKRKRLKEKTKKYHTASKIKIYIIIYALKNDYGDVV